MSALFDFPSLLVVILLFICSSSYLKALYPKIFDSAPAAQDQVSDPSLSSHGASHNGLKGLCWKASRIGDRLSPYVGVSCVLMAIHVIFIKA